MKALPEGFIRVMNGVIKDGDILQLPGDWCSKKRGIVGSNIVSGFLPIGWKVYRKPEIMVELKKEFNLVVQPVIEFLSKHYDPHTSITIDYNRATLSKEEYGVVK